MIEANYMQEDDIHLEATRARFSNVLKRHGELTERLSRDSDKMIFERLQREFEAARASQTQVNNGMMDYWQQYVNVLYAEAALRTLSLPEAYAEIVLNLPEALEENGQQKDPFSA